MDPLGLALVSFMYKQRVSHNSKFTAVSHTFNTKVLCACIQGFSSHPLFAILLFGFLHLLGLFWNAWHNRYFRKFAIIGGMLCGMMVFTPQQGAAFEALRSLLFLQNSGSISVVVFDLPLLFLIPAQSCKLMPLTVDHIEFQRVFCTGPIITRDCPSLAS